MDIGSDLVAAQAIAAAAHAVGTVNGAAIDTVGFHDAMFTLNVGSADPDGFLDVKIQESADGSTGWADITGAAFVQVTTTNANAIYQGAVKMTPSRKRYLRAVATVAQNACLFAVDAVLGGAANTPAATPAFDVYT